MSTSVNIGRTIARERRLAGITQEALAAHLGVSKAAVSKWELDQSLPDVSLLPRIAAFFSLTLDELFDWRDELTEEESAALYAEVYALGEQDLPTAHKRLHELVAEHYSDANLLLMLSSLLTMWAAGVTTALATDGEKSEAAGNAPSPEALTDEALALLDRVLDVAEKPETIFLAQQQKATALFQVGRHKEAAELLEPLVRRQDTNAAAMLLASTYRELGRNDDSLELLQAERLRAANLVLSSLMQEAGMRKDTAFAQTASAAGKAIHEALDMGTINPWYPATMALEEAEALRRTGDKEAARDALTRAANAVVAMPTLHSDPSKSPLWDHLSTRLDPTQAGEPWANHKAHQGEELQALMHQALAEQLADLE